VFPGPTQPLMVQAGWEGLLQLTVGPQVFSEYLGPQIYTLTTVADISHSALCCHSNETRAQTANLPNSAQLEGTHTILPSYIRVHAVLWACGEGQTHRHRWPLYISHCLRLTRNVITTGICVG